MKYELGQEIEWKKKKWRIIGIDSTDSPNVKPAWNYWLMNVNSETEKIRIQEEDLLTA